MTRTRVVLLWLIVALAGGVRAQPAPSWYWCEASKGYYPHVTSCSVPWREVPANAAPADRPDKDAAERERKAAEAAAAAQRRKQEEAQRAVEAKGRQYAQLRETIWIPRAENNEMTDQVDHTVISLQRNDASLLVEVVGTCVGGQAVFTALFNAANGFETVGFPGQGAGFGGIGAQLRVNDDKPTVGILIPSGFRNRFVLSHIPPASMKSTWRFMAKVSTTMGDIVLKIPVYEDHVRGLIQSCAR